MCSNYKPVTLQDRLLAHFGVARPDDVGPPEFTAPGFAAPFIVRPEHKEELAVQCRIGLYGLVPEWAESLVFGRKTYNCRAETMKKKPSFKKAWFTEHRCVIPVELLYENCHETGDPIRWAIARSDGEPLGVAGLWGIWFDPQGVEVLTFTMITVNAEGHGVFGRLHPPGAEKRMPVILREKDYTDWLHCSTEQAEAFIVRYPAELLIAYPDPAPWKVLPEPKSWKAEPDMFADEWREAVSDPIARQIKARTGRAKAKPSTPPGNGPTTGDLF